MQLSLNPLTLSTMHASGVSVASFGGERQLAFDQLQIDANRRGSLRHRGRGDRSVALEPAFYLYLARLGENRYNISDLTEFPSTSPKATSRRVRSTI